MFANGHIRASEERRVSTISRLNFPELKSGRSLTLSLDCADAFVVFIGGRDLRAHTGAG